MFDYGGTLIYEPDFNPINGNKAIYPYISKNPHNIGFEEFSTYLLNFFDEIRALRGELIEIHEHTFLRNVLEHFDMEFSVSIEEAEWIIWNGISKGVATPYSQEMLSALRNKGIRTGVISNLCWSGSALTRRLQEFFPEHNFDFIITSSEYIFRKPDSHIFDMAIRKSGLKKEDIWYCGNDMQIDIEGAYGSGIQPILYDDRTVPSKIHEKNDNFNADFPYLKINNWQELVEMIF
jgi:putative hydrolase of the HAD superfamily